MASPLLGHLIPVVAARDIPYIPDANRLQTLSIYLPRTPETSTLIGTPVGKHAAPWQRGDVIWESLQDIIALLQDSER